MDPRERPDRGGGRTGAAHVLALAMGVALGVGVGSLGPGSSRTLVVDAPEVVGAPATRPDRPTDGAQEAAVAPTIESRASGPSDDATDVGDAPTATTSVPPAAERAAGAPTETAPGGGLADDGGGATVTRAPSSTARGVSDQAIRVGVAVLDLGPLRNLGPEYDNGTPEEQWDAMLDGWRRSGRVPIHGRDLELIYRRYRVADSSSEREACVGLVKDDRVFAVIGIAYFRVGAECVAREFSTPLITADGPDELTMARSHPFLFSVGMSNDRIVRTMIHFGHHEGLLAGRTIGVYHLNDRLQTRLVEETVRPELERLGYQIAVVHTTDEGLGGPQDAVAVQRFRTEGVDLALLFTSKLGFMQQAEAQGYRPTYLESDHDFGTQDTTTRQYPPEQFDGTRGVTGRRSGEVNAGEPPGERQTACLDNFERYTGRRPEAETSEWSYVLMGCDEGELLLHALEAAGPNLDAASFIAGLETLSDQPLRRYLPVTYTPTKHHGSDWFREVVWHADCRCWRATGPHRPAFTD